MTNVQVGAAYAEVVTVGASDVRAAAAYAEAVTIGTSNAKFAGVFAEALVTPTVVQSGAVSMSAASSTLVASGDVTSPPVQDVAVSMSVATTGLSVAGTVTSGGAVLNGTVAMTTTAPVLTVVGVRSKISAVAMTTATKTLTATGLVTLKQAIVAMTVTTVSFTAAGTVKPKVSAVVAMSSATEMLTVVGVRGQAALASMSVALALLSVFVLPPSAVVVLDDYNRADSTTIGAGSIGPAPIEVFGDTAISGNEISSVTATSMLVYDTGYPDALCEVTVGSTDSYDLRVVVRSDTTNDAYWELSCTWDGTLTLGAWSSANGGFIFPYSQEIGAGPPPGDVFGLRVIGNTFSGFLNGTKLFDYTDTTLIGAGNTGQGVKFGSGSSSTATNIQITAYGVSPTLSASVAMTATSSMDATPQPGGGTQAATVAMTAAITELSATPGGGALQQASVSMAVGTATLVVGATHTATAVVVMTAIGTLTADAKIATLFLPLEDVITYYDVTALITFDPPVATPPVARPALLDPTVAPSVADTGSGNLAAGTYDYAYQWWQFDPSRNTVLSPVGWITVPDGSEITITVPSNADADGYILWRRMHGGSAADWRML